MQLVCEHQWLKSVSHRWVVHLPVLGTDTSIYRRSGKWPHVYEDLSIDMVWRRHNHPAHSSR